MMTLRIAHQTGRIFHAAQHPAMAEIRPCYAFVPQEHFGANGFEKPRYLASRWPAINAGANPHAIGSHIIPDASNPVSPRSRCPILGEFLVRLKTIAAVKASPTTE